LRILWLASYSIWPPTHGGKIRVYNLVRRLAAMGNEVEVWSISDEAPPTSAPDLPGVTLRYMRNRQRTSRQAKAAAAMSALPSAAWVLRSPEVLAAIRTADRFDVVVVGQSVCGALVPQIAELGMRWVFDAHNVEWWLSWQISRRLPNAVTKFRFALDALKFRRLEKRLLQSATAVVAVSQQDADRLHQLAPSTKIEIRPNGVDLEYFRFVDHSTPGGANLIMTGTLGYYPNLDASLWLIHEILPRVRERLRNTTLTLVGGEATPELIELEGPAVHVVGQVSDVRPYAAAADVFVVPLRLGSGTRLKALEALASGLPIVATRLAVEGLGLVERKLVLVGETPVELASAIERAITDRALRARLVEEGRRYAAECFGWDRITSDFQGTLDRAAHG
jgi:glycosyltransferase involved in cell wall biosynthesis